MEAILEQLNLRWFSGVVGERLAGWESENRGRSSDAKPPASEDGEEESLPAKEKRVGDEDG